MLRFTARPFTLFKNLCMYSLSLILFILLKFGKSRNLFRLTLKITLLCYIIKFSNGIIIRLLSLFIGEYYLVLNNHSVFSMIYWPHLVRNI